jgi:AP endonuclease 1
VTVEKVVAEDVKPKATRKKKEPEPVDVSPSNRKYVSSPWKIGAHISAAGGVENAIVNAHNIG